MSTKKEIFGMEAYLDDEEQNPIKKYYTDPSKVDSTTEYERLLKQSAGNNGGIYDATKSYDQQGWGDDFMNSLSSSDTDAFKNAYGLQSQEQKLMDMTNQNLADLQTNKESTLRNSYVQNEIDKKNTETRMQSNGLGSLGISQSYMSDSNNKYNNLVAGINGEANSEKNAIRENYLDKSLSIDEKLKAENDASTNERFDTAYSDFENYLNMSDTDNFDELLTEFEKAHSEGKLRDDDYDRLVKTAQIHQKNMSKQEAITFINGMVEEPENHDIEDVEKVIQEAFDNGTIGQSEYDNYMKLYINPIKNSDNHKVEQGKKQYEATIDKLGLSKTESSDYYFKKAESTGSDSEELQYAMYGAVMQLYSDPNWKPAGWAKLQNYSADRLHKMYDETAFFFGAGKANNEGYSNRELIEAAGYKKALELGYLPQ